MRKKKLLLFFRRSSNNWGWCSGRNTNVRQMLALINKGTKQNSFSQSWYMVSLDALRKCEGKGGIIEKFAIAADSNKCLKPFILPITRAHLVHVYHIKCHALSKHSWMKNSRISTNKTFWLKKNQVYRVILFILVLLLQKLFMWILYQMFQNISVDLLNIIMYWPALSKWSKVYSNLKKRPW